MNPVVVIGAGLAGLAAACQLTGRGYDVTVVERATSPGGRAGRAAPDGFSFDTGPTVLTMPDLIAEPLRAVGADLGRRPSRCSSSTRRTGPCSPTAAPSTSAPVVEAMRARSPRPAAASTRPRSTSSSPGCASSTWSRCRTSSTATSTPRSDCSPSRARRRSCCGCGAFGRLGRRGPAPVPGPAAAPAVLLPGHVRRARARRRARALRGDHLHGQHRRRLLPRGRHARDARGMARAAEKAGAAVPLRRARSKRSSAPPPAGWPASGWPADGRSPPTPWSARSTCPPRTSSCCPICRRRARSRHGPTTRRRRWSGTSASAGCPSPRSPTTTSTSASSGARAFDALMKRGR